MRRSMKSIAWRFQSTPPARGATTSCDPRFPSRNDFNPRPPRGGRRRQFFLILAAVHFNPRPPRGGRRYPARANIRRILFQSTPPARGATLSFSACSGLSLISIHAPREGGDQDELYNEQHHAKFQSTPPARGATLSLLSRPRLYRFQSTPPARGATGNDDRRTPSKPIFQSTPPARGATIEISKIWTSVL